MLVTYSLLDTGIEFIKDKSLDIRYGQHQDTKGQTKVRSRLETGEEKVRNIQMCSSGHISE